MSRQRAIIFGILFFAARLLSAQVIFTQVPVNFQLIPRDASGFGTFTVAGINLHADYKKIRTRITDTVTKTVIEDKLTDAGAGSEFSVTHKIPAGLAEYELKVWVSNGTALLLVKTVKRLVSGDCFVICGQSNAMAAANWDNESYTMPYLRGIGTNDDPLHPDAPCVVQNLDFAQANPAWLQNGFVGAWGMKLQRDLALETRIPSCFINGARGGTSILQNLPSKTPSDVNALDTCLPYDRLYRKVARHRLNAAVRALFWYQGETDGDAPTDTVMQYAARFDLLYKAWKTDYPNLEKIVVMQVNTGCNEKNLGLLRDQQRGLGDAYKDVVLMSTFSPDSADRAGDQCHYTFRGYNKLADLLFPLVKKHIYKYSLPDTLFMPPRILKIEAIGLRQLCIQFDQRITVQPSKAYRTSVEYIKDYFYDGEDTILGLQNVTASGNKVLLDFIPGTKLPTAVTYMPQSLTNAHTALYVGPYIVNANSPAVAALSFYKYPVSTRPLFTPGDFLVYPNPAIDVLNIRLYGQERDARISVIDALGRVVMQLRSPGSEAELDIRNLEKGIYVVKLDLTAGTFTKKVVLQ